MNTVDSDATYREELTSRVSEADLRSAFERRYGRGWQRKLGAALDVPETTVNGWFKAGKFPSLAKLAFGVLLSRQVPRPSQHWCPIKNGAKYAVCDTEGPIGRFVADDISNPEDATLVAAAPQLQDAARDTHHMLINLYEDDNYSWLREVIAKLEAALDAAQWQ